MRASGQKKGESEDPPLSHSNQSLRRDGRQNSHVGVGYGQASVVERSRAGHKGDGVGDHLDNADGRIAVVDIRQLTNTLEGLHGAGSIQRYDVVAGLTDGQAGMEADNRRKSLGGERSLGAEATIDGVGRGARGLEGGRGGGVDGQRAGSQAEIANQLAQRFVIDIRRALPFVKSSFVW